MNYHKAGELFYKVREIIARQGEYIKLIKLELSTNEILTTTSPYSALNDFRYSIINFDEEVYNRYPLYSYFLYDPSDPFLIWCQTNERSHIIPYHSKLQALMSLAYTIDCEENNWVIVKSIIDGTERYYLRNGEDIYDPQNDYYESHYQKEDEIEVTGEDYTDIINIPNEIYITMKWHYPLRRSSLSFENKKYNSNENLRQYLLIRRLSNRSLSISSKEDKHEAISC